MDIIKVAESNPTGSDSPKIVGLKDVAGFLRFVEWMSTPRHLRKPEHQKAFAKIIGVHEDTLTDWKRHPQFFPLVQSRISGWIKERVPDVIGALYENASGKGKAQDVESFLRLAGVLSQPKARPKK